MTVKAAPEFTLEIPRGDDKERRVCQRCDFIDYQNPKIVAGCIPVWKDEVLLCKRAIEPRYGYWTLPAGFMELGETSLEAGMRETMEEANARVKVEDLFSVFNLPYVGQVYMMFRANLLDLDFSAGVESLEVRLFKEEDIPWNELAFTTIRATLKSYFEDRKKGVFSLHTGDVVKTEAGYEFVPTLV